MPALNNVTTTDDYTDANTLRCGMAVRVNLMIANAAIYYRLGYGTPQALRFRDEAFALPGIASLDRRCDAVQIRSAAPGVPAQVSIDAVTSDEVGGEVNR